MLSGCSNGAEQMSAPWQVRSLRKFSKQRSVGGAPSLIVIIQSLTNRILLQELLPQLLVVTAELRLTFRLKGVLELLTFPVVLLPGLLDFVVNPLSFATLQSWLAAAHGAASSLELCCTCSRCPQASLYFESARLLGRMRWIFPAKTFMELNLNRSILSYEGCWH